MCLLNKSNTFHLLEVFFYMYLGISIIEPKNYQFALYFLQHSYQSNYLPKHKFKIIARYHFVILKCLTSWK